MTLPQGTPIKQDIVKYLDKILRESGGSISDPATRQALLDVMSTTMAQASTNPIVLHGFRVESMFAYVARAMGHCPIVKEEDAGELYSAIAALKSSDFRVLTKDGYEFLVEVKNCNRTDPDKSYQFRPLYFEALKAYANLLKKDLKIAIYWPRIRSWSLTSANDFVLSDGRYSLSMKECLKRSEMHIIGDSVIGTVPPLALRLLPDPAQPITEEEDGQIGFTIGNVEFWCGGVRVDDPFEQQLAWFLMLYGEWEIGELVGERSASGSLLFAQLEAQAEQIGGEHFAIIGSLSQMISTQYNVLTAPEGTITRLTPTGPPDELGIVIPFDYKGQAVRLWRLIIRPNRGQ